MLRRRCTYDVVVVAGQPSQIVPLRVTRLMLSEHMACHESVMHGRNGLFGLLQDCHATLSLTRYNGVSSAAHLTASRRR